MRPNSFKSSWPQPYMVSILRLNLVSAPYTVWSLEKRGQKSKNGTLVAHSLEKAVINQEILSLQREILLGKLKDIDKQMGSVSLRPKKGYTLRFLNGKYFVQYVDAETGKYLPLKRSLGTADRLEADKRAVEYREAFIDNYNRKKSRIKNICERRNGASSFPQRYQKNAQMSRSAVMTSGP